MTQPAKHLVFYDGKCGLCDRFVQFLLKVDKNVIFVFAPLQGKTAETRLQSVCREVKEADSVILIENYEQMNTPLIYGKAAFRVLWLLGGCWALLGWLNFLPSWIYDWGYRLVAKNRYRLFIQETCVIPSAEHKHRFLD